MNKKRTIIYKKYKRYIYVLVVGFIVFTISAIVLNEKEFWGTIVMGLCTLILGFASLYNQEKLDTKNREYEYEKELNRIRPHFMMSIHLEGNTIRVSLYNHSPNSAYDVYLSNYLLCDQIDSFKKCEKDIPYDSFVDEYYYDGNINEERYPDTLILYFNDYHNNTIHNVYLLNKENKKYDLYETSYI